MSKIRFGPPECPYYHCNHYDHDNCSCSPKKLKEWGETFAQLYKDALLRYSPLWFWQ